MRRTALLFSLLALAAHTAEAKGPPWIRATLPADYQDATRRGVFMIIHTFHHADPMPFGDISGTAEGLVNGARRSVPMQIVLDTTTQGQYLIPKTWPDGGVWVLNIGGHLDMQAGLVIGVGRSGTPVLVQTPRTATGVSRPATAREVEQLLRYLDGQRASVPPLSASRWGILLTPPGMFAAAMVLAPVLLIGLLVRRFLGRRQERDVSVGVATAS